MNKNELQEVKSWLLENAEKFMVYTPAGVVYANQSLADEFDKTFNK